MKHKITLVITALVLTALLFSCGGAGSSPSATVDAFLKACQTYDIEIMNECFPSAQFDTSGDANEAFARELYSRMTYELGETLEGDEDAVQKLTLTTVDLSAIFTEIFTDTDILDDILAQALQNAAGLNSYLMGLVTEKLGDEEAILTTISVEVNLEKDENGKWIISPETENAGFVNALAGNLQAANEILESLFNG